MNTLRILLDTTQETLMLAIADDTQIVARHQDSNASQRYHSSVLLPTLTSMLEGISGSVSNIRSIAINIGPGSFTGIRTGLTFARLMGQFMPVQLHAFNMFELIAACPQYRNQPVSICLNAYRNQHYYSQLCASAEGEVHWETPPCVLPNIDTTLTAGTIVQSSLMPHLMSKPETLQPLEDLNLFTPEAMLFLLGCNSTSRLTSWQQLEPLYLQGPHITISKKKSLAEGGKNLARDNG